MHIQELSLRTRHVTNQKAFYCTTRLHFQETQQDVLYHVAFTIPRNTFHEAKSWTQKRVPLLHKNGEDEIFFANLNARSFYFCDTAGNILEFIVHYGLNYETEG